MIRVGAPSGTIPAPLGGSGPFGVRPATAKKKAFERQSEAPHRTRVLRLLAVGMS
jgi:hypothetical protein